MVQLRDLIRGADDQLGYRSTLSAETRAWVTSQRGKWRDELRELLSAKDPPPDAPTPHEPGCDCADCYYARLEMDFRMGPE